MRSDAQLQEAVLKALEWERSINAAQIGVTVADGVVTLSGDVGTLREKTTAEHAADHVWGVRAVANSLKVEPDGPLARADAAIAAAAATAIAWHSAVPPDSVTVDVREGWVTLTGSVTWQYQKAAAGKVVEHLYGVKGVLNEVVVKTPFIAADVHQQIERAFRRNAEVDAHRITVEARNGIVILKGIVRAQSEREAAESAAWAAPGIVGVNDQIVVDP